jgi:multidrug efflux pump subunit AcrA (membrane-fusion protein)
MKIKNKKLYLIGLILLFLALLSIYLWRASQWIEVRPDRAHIVESIYALGTVESDRKFELKTGVPMTIEHLMIKEGDLVKKGQQILKYQNGPQVLSPLTGTTVSVYANEFEILPAGTKVLEIQDLNKLYVEVALEQQSVMRVRRGQRVRISFESLRAEKYMTQVESVYPRQQNFIVKLPLPEKIPGVLPGMTVDVAIEVGQKSDALVVPLKAIAFGKIRMIRKNHRDAELVSVKIGMMDEDRAEIIDPPLSQEDLILIRK